MPKSGVPPRDIFLITEYCGHHAWFLFELYGDNITLIRRIRVPTTKRPFKEGYVLSIEKMKRRALHLRLLIDKSKSKKKKEEAIREYVSLIQRIT